MTAAHTTWNSCFCSCHSVIPVFITDRVHAATACSACYRDHVQKYSKDEKPPKQPIGDTSTSWQGDGEGAE